MSNSSNHSLNNRPILIIDETRRGCEGVGELILYSIVQTTAMQSEKYYREMALIREELPQQLRSKVFKGKDLFGRERRSFEPLKQRVLKELIESDNIVFFITHKKEIKAKANPLTGGFNAIPAPGFTRPPKRVFGDELLPVFNVVKQIAIEQNFGHGQVDVLIDRSAQLGLAPLQRGMSMQEGEALFETFGPTTFDGCLTQFTIISASEKGRALPRLLWKLGGRLKSSPMLLGVGVQVLTCGRGRSALA